LWGAEGAALAQAQNVALEGLLLKLRPSVAVLGDPRQPAGAAALIDAQQGLFVAHRDAVRGDTVQARIGDGTFRLKVLNLDTRTDLVLLAYQTPEGFPAGSQISVAEAEPVAGSKVMVLLANGGLVGSFVGGNRFAVAGVNRQAIPVSELRFETPPQLVGGALVISFEGKLLGTMGATLARPGNVATVPLKTLNDVRGAVGGAGGAYRPGGGAPVLPGFPKLQSFYGGPGPAPLTVAYTPSLSVVRRVIEGFTSEGHRAEFAALGVLVDESLGGGAVIKLVVPDSPASHSGVRVGDVLLRVGDRSISKQLDFVQALLAYRPGEHTTLRIRRDGVERTLEVVLARSKA
jgi:S1-C subfamily serine protease